MEIKSAWASKINWTAAATAAISLAAAFGLELDGDTRTAILSVAGITGPALIIVLRTFFTKSVTPAVAKKL